MPLLPYICSENGALLNERSRPETKRAKLKATPVNGFLQTQLHWPVSSDNVVSMNIPEERLVVNRKENIFSILFTANDADETKRRNGVSLRCKETIISFASVHQQSQSVPNGLPISRVRSPLQPDPKRIVF